MDNGNKHIDDLLARYFSGEASAQEGVEVGTWLSESEANRAYFRQYRVLWEQSAAPGDFEPDVDAAWMKVKHKTLHKPQMHVSKSPAKEQKRFFTQLKIAASIIIVSGIGLTAYRFLRQPAPQHITLTATTPVMKATLPDSSSVMLRNGSKLQYPETFAASRREVTLIGEAFFDIRRQPEKPFLIHAGGTEIQVLGTSFNIRSVTGSFTEVSVKTGKVQFTAPNGTSAVLTAGMMAIYRKSSGTIIRSDIPAENVGSAITGTLTFRDSRLEDVIADLNRHYNVTIVLEDPAAYNCRLTTSFQNTSLDNALAIISSTFALKTGRQGNTILLSGKGCAAD